MTEGELTLHQASESLGVHYMTAYRYVRLGLLDARKLQGTWRVAGEDLERFRSSNAATSPQPIGSAGVDRRRTAPWAQRLEARLVAGDLRGSWGVIEAALAAGSGLDDLYLGVPDGRLRSSFEHCSSIVKRADELGYQNILHPRPPNHSTARRSASSTATGR